jgi:chromosome partitioning protein
MLLVVADALLLTLKMSDLDIVGTRELVEEIYGSFTKSFLLWNRVSGYCLPHNIQDDTTPYSTASASTTAPGTSANLDQPALKSRSSLLMEKQHATETNMEKLLTSETGMQVISAIPCYCDIQFGRKEFLTPPPSPKNPDAGNSGSTGFCPNYILPTA